MAATAPEPRRLMVVSDRRRLAPRRLDQYAAEAAHAGIDFFQVREKDLADGALLALAREVVSAAGGRMRVLVNGRPDVAVMAGAHGVQLPERGLPVAQVRRSFPALLVGASCHSLEAALRAEAEGADHVLMGPVFPTPGKERPLGLAVIEEAVRALRAPVHAIGGIDARRAPAVWAAGVAGVAAIRAFLEVPVERAARELKGEGETAA